MKEFKFMQETVDMICKSMVEDHSRWKVGTYTVTDRNKGVEYWTATSGGPITEVWKYSSAEAVFSTEQGWQFRGAYDKMREIKASQRQQEVLDTFKRTYTNKPWWKFWE
jgi:hypothetical protein